MIIEGGCPRSSPLGVERGGAVVPAGRAVWTSAGQRCDVLATVSRLVGTRFADDRRGEGRHEQCRGEDAAVATREGRRNGGRRCLAAQWGGAG